MYLSSAPSLAPHLCTNSYILHLTYYHPEPDPACLLLSLQNLIHRIGQQTQPVNPLIHHTLRRIIHNLTIRKLLRRRRIPQRHLPLGTKSHFGRLSVLLIQIQQYGPGTARCASPHIVREIIPHVNPQRSILRIALLVPFVARNALHSLLGFGDIDVLFVRRAINPLQIGIPIDAAQFLEEFGTFGSIIFPTHAKIEVRRETEYHEHGIGLPVRHGPDDRIGMFFLDRLQRRDDFGIEMPLGGMMPFPFPRRIDAFDDGLGDRAPGPFFGGLTYRRGEAFHLGSPILGAFLQFLCEHGAFHFPSDRLESYFGVGHGETGDGAGFFPDANAGVGDIVFVEIVTVVGHGLDED
mmetsp:Transcript_26980/g.46003  ORF Transcript_26980/g.46003 Transcript_26980/m.46003 type:complete len:351 (-) Transcript_26980:394-1446(-)